MQTLYLAICLWIVRGGVLSFDSARSLTFHVVSEDRRYKLWPIVRKDRFGRSKRRCPSIYSFDRVHCSYCCNWHEHTVSTEAVDDRYDVSVA